MNSKRGEVYFEDKRMEPMNLGSPVHSPPAPGGNSSGFLPGFLMGDASSSFSSPAPSRIISPTKLNRSLNQTGVTGAHNHHGLHQAQSSITPSAAAAASASRFQSNMGGKPQTPRTPVDNKTPGGPPVTGLYSKVGTPVCLKFPHTPSTPHQSFGVASGGDLPEEPWVTVFGFPPAATGYVLSQFSQYGVILQHSKPPNGNWLHIQYQTKIQAQKALAKNGKILGGSIMIGVRPGGVGEEEDEPSFHQRCSDTHNESVLNSSRLDGSQLLNRSSMRPLTQAYKVSQTQHEVLADSNTPNKNEGFVNKAMEYIFGW